ncbi:MAG: hypothetical protein K6G79_09155 [Bacteroidales bacterium]|nr:hypothetical protein [Bacteroidales bacterium]
MKRFLLLTLTAMMSLSASYAQQPVYLFPEFEPSTIRFINRTTAEVKVNFDALGQGFYYYDGATMMELLNRDLIKDITVGDRTFIFKDGLFCEVFERESGRVLVNWKFKKVNVGSKGALGATTQAKVDVLNGSSEYINEIWQQKNDNTYIITVGDTDYSVKRLKDLYRAFPTVAGQLKAFVRENKLEMTSAEQAFRVIDYLRSIL